MRIAPMPGIEDPGIEDPVIEDPGIAISGMPVPAPFDMSDAAVMPGDIPIIECGFAAFPPGAGTFSIIRAMACAAASLIPARPARSSSGARMAQCLVLHRTVLADATRVTSVRPVEIRD
jgi:hypothetical protein